MKNALFKIIGVSILAFSLIGGWLLMSYQDFLRTPLRVPQGATPTSIAISPGASLKSVANELHAAGLLDHPYFFILLGRWEGLAGNIRAGEYEIEPGIVPRELLEKLVSGEVMLHSLTIVEGWSFKQLMDAVSQHPKLKHTLASLDEAQIMTKLGYPGVRAEGRFLPDTYKFPIGTSDVEFLKRAYAAMEKYLAQQWPQRAPDLPYRTPYEALILASIVEKETGVPSERAEIAGVFVRRLGLGMRLQSDPTVIYGMGAMFDGNLRRADLLALSPYNTYTNAGLPPTPIAMPGQDAIHAVLHPADGNTLYFVSRGDGSHYFSATLEAHNAAVRRYQLRR